MAGRGGFEAITSGDMDRLLAQPYAERWDFTKDGMKSVFGIPMDKAWKRKREKEKRTQPAPRSLGKEEAM
jgi:hypothetical protein